MSWHDIDIYLTIGSALVGGTVAGWFTRGSLPRGLLGFAIVVYLSGAFMLAPRAVSALRLWLYIPQEVSLTQELLIDRIVVIPLAGFLTGIGWLFGFAQYRCCRRESRSP